MADERTVLTVSRLWHHPHIHTTISRRGIAMEMPMEDFLEALMREMGTVALTFTESGLRAQMQSASQRVVDGIKEESAKAV